MNTDINQELFLSCFKQRCKDIFIQNWHHEMDKNSQCKVYKLFKEVPKIENYLINLEDIHKFTLVSFITRVHHLPITYNRFNYMENNVCNICRLCNKGAIGDESHYLFKCEFYKKNTGKDSSQRSPMIQQILHGRGKI